MQNALRNRSVSGVVVPFPQKQDREMAMRRGEEEGSMKNGQSTAWSLNDELKSRTRIVEERSFGRLTALDVSVGGAPERQKVRTLVYQPGRFSSRMPVCMVMHGVTRKAETYMESWVGLAEHHGFVLVVPEFPRSGWPTSREYNFGNVRSRGGEEFRQEDWTFTAVETVFDAVRAQFDLSAPDYAMYGHSAGAQFVHRFILHTGAPRVSCAVAANAGWYMVPDKRVSFPYGIADLSIDCETLKNAFATQLTVLLGERDNDPESPDLRTSKKAQAQGPHRLARGQHFIEATTSIALNGDHPFEWRAKTVPQVGHSDRAMAPFACAALFGKRERA